MIKMMLKATVSHTALEIGMRAWAYKIEQTGTAKQQAGQWGRYNTVDFVGLKEGERVTFVDEASNVTPDMWTRSQP